MGHFVVESDMVKGKEPVAETREGGEIIREKVVGSKLTQSGSPSTPNTPLSSSQSSKYPSTVSYYTSRTSLTSPIRTERRPENG